ncbi:MAG: amino-acid N-acetyltransferase [Opitutales bacterium]
MSQDLGIENAIKPTDLRGILKYVPMFRNHVFVISFDGSIVEHEQFADLLLDIAVLRNLNIQVVIVHGIGKQMRQKSKERGIAITDVYGSGPTDQDTLDLAIECSLDVEQKFQKGLTRSGLRFAIANVVTPTEVGLIDGVDFGYTGKASNIHSGTIEALMKSESIPIISPIAYDRAGRAYRLNADSLAAECAIALNASKLIFLSPRPGITIGDEVRINIPSSELEDILQTKPESVDEACRLKAERSVYALKNGVTRAHIIDGRVFGGLLTEIFDKVGIGSMIHANAYQEIRKARPKDIQAIYDITRHATRNASLKPRSRSEIDKEISNTWVYEIDGSIIACMQLKPDETRTVFEVGMVLVQSFYQKRGVGKKMVEFAEMEAKKQGAEKLLALTTQSYPFFKHSCEFADGSKEDLPEARRADYEANGRASKILVRTLK